MRKIDKIIIYGIFGSIPAGLLLFFLYNMIWGPSVKQMTTERYLSESVNGVVDTLYNDKSNHDIRTIILKNGSFFQVEQLWESEVEVGDSLYKKQGLLFLDVYRKNGKKIVLDYRTLIP